MPQIVHDRLANVDRQRKTIATPTLADGHDFSSPPIDIVQTHLGDLTACNPTRDINSSIAKLRLPAP